MLFFPQREKIQNGRGHWNKKSVQLIEKMNGLWDFFEGYIFKKLFKSHLPLERSHVLSLSHPWTVCI